MPSGLSPSDLMQAHVALSMGGYLSGSIPVNSNWEYVYSDRITDYYWNLAFSTHATEVDLSSETIAAIELVAGSVDRPSAVWIPGEHASHAIPSDFTLASSEVWMTTSDLPARSGLDDSSIVISGDVTPDFLTVFESAYGESNDVGYSELPSSYVEGLKSAVPEESVTIQHYTFYNSDEPVAIVSTYIANGIAGLYNVGTIPNARRKGFARTLSEAALSDLADKKPKFVMLQTVPDSPAEEFYGSMGFNREFVASTYKVEIQ